MALDGKRVLVVGLGRSGRAAASLARTHGARVIGVDLRTGLAPIDGVVLELGPHRRERFDEADLIVVSPGIPLTQPDIAHALATGKQVVGELGFAAAFLDLPMVAVTGTNGKSTVTSFTGQLLAAAGRRPFVGGNLGNPLSNAILEADGEDCLAVEVSSYQLELPGTLRPDVGVILNLTPDHLARHGTMEAYGRAKARLFERMGPAQIAALPADDALLRSVCGDGARRVWLGAHPGVVRRERRVVIALPTVEVELSLDGFRVPGAHNLDNAATAAMLALALGADPDAVQRGLDRLVALDHRMQVVAEGAGVRWINDSKATNVGAARAGIGGLEAAAVVLLGGQGKPNPDGSLGFDALGPLLARHRAVVTFGEAGPRIAEELAREGIETVGVAALDDAVAAAADLARPGDAVLLSPGCASFDAFTDFEHRGRAFAEAARRRSP